MKLLVAGFVLSLLGSLPPGLISLSVAHTAIRRGLAAAWILALGAAFAEFFQAWAAVVLSEWFLSRPTIELTFRWLAALIFLILGIYLIFFSVAPKTPVEAPKITLWQQFLKGIVISAFNLLAIPYWFTYCGWLRMEGWWQEKLSATLLFSGGVMLGTIAALFLYAWLGMLIVQRAAHIARHANRFLGLIFLALALKLFWALMC